MQIDSDEFQETLCKLFQYVWDHKSGEMASSVEDEVIKEDVIEARFQDFPAITFKRTRHGHEAEDWVVVKK